MEAAKKKAPGLGLLAYLGRQTKVCSDGKC